LLYIHNIYEADCLTKEISDTLLQKKNLFQLLFFLVLDRLISVSVLTYTIFYVNFPFQFSNNFTLKISVLNLVIILQ